MLIETGIAPDLKKIEPGVCSFYRPREDERLSRPWSHPKPLGGSKVDSAFHPPEVDRMSTRNFWELSGKK